MVPAPPPVRPVTLAALVLGSVLMLAGCSRPYAEAEVQSSRGAPGILTLAGPAPADEGLRARLIATHGMCSGDQGAWPRQRAAEYRAVLGDPNPVWAGPPNGAVPDGPPDVHANVARVNGPDGRFEIVLLHWGTLVDVARARLDYDNHRAGAVAPEPDPAIGPHPRRARLNHLGRAVLMNRCLLDAAVYLGSAGDPIRHGMRRALCTALGGTPGATRGGAPGAPASWMDCTRMPGAARPPVPTFLLPESLGSAILFDALVALSCNDSFRHALSDVRAIYLRANQVPLLAQGSAGPPCRGRLRLARAPGGSPAAPEALGSLGAFLDLYAQPEAALRRTRATDRGPVHLVALTDPNDVLGYRLDPDGVRPDFVVSNVLVSNAPTWFGLAANPLAAHRGYDRDQIARLLRDGHPPGTTGD